MGQPVAQQVGCLKNGDSGESRLCRRVFYRRGAEMRRDCNRSGLEGIRSRNGRDAGCSSAARFPPLQERRTFTHGHPATLNGCRRLAAKLCELCVSAVRTDLGARWGRETYSGCTTSTGRFVDRITLSVTLPTRKRRTPPRPWVLISIRSMPAASAYSTILSAA